MKKEAFEELIESVREGGAILREEKEPARTFKYEKFKAEARAIRRNKEQRAELFAICVYSDDSMSLEVRKVYRVLLDERAAEDDYLRVVDESGEDYLYPADHFILLKVTNKAHLELLKAS
jgi:hypothetical protein